MQPTAGSQTVSPSRGGDSADGANERPWGVILAAVAPDIAHVLDLGFVELRELVLLGLRGEAELVEVIDDLAQIVAALVLRRGPRVPTMGRIEDVGVWLAVQGGFGGLVVFKSIEVFQEQERRGLLGVIKFTGATGVFSEDVVDIFEGLFEHICLFS